ncbi:MAG TPA: hypothetical protein VMX77_02650 [Candidatus Bathyarchaeia archaeon]|nr:hypothetical protein [Candidatus Bathyarchaeia archaeon]
MAEEKARKGPVSRKVFFKGAAAIAAELVGLTLAGCGIKRPEPPPEPLPEPPPPPETLEDQLGRLLQEALRKTEKAGEGLVVDGVTKTADFFSPATETPISCLPIGGDQGDQFQIGFLGAGVEVSSSYLVSIKNPQGKGEEYRAWDIILVDPEEDLNSSFLEFAKVEGWDKKRSADRITQNKDHFVSLGGRVALFCFNAKATQDINEARPTGPTP